jgi:hypothetical protein
MHCLGDDILRTVGKISQHVFGNDDPAHRRKIYHLVETDRLPVFRLGKLFAPEIHVERMDR